MPAAGTPATLALARARVPHTLHPYQHDPSVTHFGEETVKLLGVDPHRVFKTLVVACTGGPALAVGVVPVSGQLDLKAMAAALGAKKAALADEHLAERTTGYLVGGISPVGQKKQLPTIIDSSAEELETMLVSGGRRGLQVELAPADLARLVRARFAPIGR